MARSFLPQPIALVLRTAAWTVGLYGLLWLIASIWVGGRSPTIDIDRGLHNVYKTDVREFLYHLPAFCEQAKGRNNLIIIGGSTAQAYDPKVIAPYTKGWQVSRIALDFGNVTQMRQSIDLLRQCMGEEAFARSRIVLGLSYVSMVTTARRFPTPYTMLELEQKRHGLFTGEPGALQPTIPWNNMGLAVDAGRPVILAHYLVTGARDLLGDARMAIGRLRQGGGAPAPRDSAARDAEAIADYDDKMGDDPAATLADQGGELAGLIADVRAAGAEIVLVAVPEKAVVRQDSKHIAAYYDWLAAFAPAHRLTVLHQPATDADFHDRAHASQQGGERWSQAIAPAIAATLPGMTTNAATGEAR